MTLAWLDRIIDAGEAETPAGRALVEERYNALRRQIPLLYLIGLANLAGLFFTSGGSIDSIANPVTPMLALIVLRLAYWVKVRRTILPPQRILAELRKTFAYALVFCLAFCSWALHLLGRGNDGVILFGSLAAVGCAYGLSSYAAAARIPLLVLGLPLASRLIVSAEPGRMAMGVSLSLILLLILHLLRVNDQRFERLVESRSEIAAERERAMRAERLAKVEQAKAKKIADTDPLTGLANRRAFLRRLARRAAALGRSGPGDLAGFALAIVDLDGFKPINDTFGHATGDAVLEEVGARLTTLGGPAALAARMGGD
jgi:predicted signal transduction protein with EAL and GGDEF domain